jgi:hypothetical protein
MLDVGWRVVEDEDASRAQSSIAVRTGFVHERVERGRFEEGLAT